MVTLFDIEMIYIENLAYSGIRYYGTGRITHDNYVQFIRHDALGFEYIDQSKNFVPQVHA